MDYLSSAADLVAGGRFHEAEIDALRALSLAPLDVRALKVVALARFKLGRLDEARAVCREIATASPDDASIRLKLGLIALKLDRMDEAVEELELCTGLAPEDARAWSYLGFAHVRRGDRASAAAAFRRGGQEAKALEVEAERAEDAAPAGESAPIATDALGPSARREGSEVTSTVTPETPFDLLAESYAAEPRTDPERFLSDSPGGYGSIVAAPLVGYAVSRLEPAANHTAWVGATARLTIGDELFVRGDAAVACMGSARWEPAWRRVQGRATAQRLGDHAPAAAYASSGADRASASESRAETGSERDDEGGAFLRVTGRGEVFVGAPAGRLVPLLLEQDILYVREDRVLAFEGSVAWEYGHVPRGGLRMLQFRGRGLVAIRVDGEPGAVKVTPERPVLVSRPYLLGWIGRVVACGPAAGTQVVPFGISCEGEGVVLVDVRANGRAKERP